MSTESAIAIFALNPSVRTYLADIVKLAGFSPVTEVVETAQVIIAASPMKNTIGEGQSVLALADRIVPEGPGVRVLKPPLRAARMIEILQREMQAIETVPARLAIGDCFVDTRHNLWLPPKNTAAVRLTGKEVAILARLRMAGGKVVSRQALLETVWSYAEGVETHTLETHIYRLRQKIERDPSTPKVLLTDGDGYKLAI